jgi:hypothetical protein
MTMKDAIEPNDFRATLAALFKKVTEPKCTPQANPLEQIVDHGRHRVRWSERSTVEWAGRRVEVVICLMCGIPAWMRPMPLLPYVCPLNIAYAASLILEPPRRPALFRAGLIAELRSLGLFELVDQAIERLRVDHGFAG